MMDEGAVRQHIQATKRSIELSRENADVNRRMAAAYSSGQPLVKALPADVLQDYEAALREEAESVAQLAAAAGRP